MGALPKCSTCKYFQKGHCKLFLDVYDEKLSFAKARDVRSDETLCGTSGLYWILRDREDPRDPRDREDPDNFTLYDGVE